MGGTVLLLGSGPSVTECADWPRAPFDHIVALNNAWRVRPDWDYLVCPDDFPPDRRPPRIMPDQQIITSDLYVPANNAYGGIIYAGGTMAFSASYWALHALRPGTIAYLGCDMVYPVTGHTHFYGTGDPDPLRDDITLRSLEAKSARLLAKAAQQGCALLNLSTTESRLVFPRATRTGLTAAPQAPSAEVIAKADQLETEANYRAPSGRYWQDGPNMDPATIDAIDAAWLSALPQPSP